MTMRHHGLLCTAAALVATATLNAPARAGLTDAVQYFHPLFEHYFVAVGDDIAALDQGRHPGWWRTGTHYRVDAAPEADLHAVCRFYTGAFAGKASHFFTASEEECAAVKSNRDWTFEGVVFYARVADAGGNCAHGTAPVHRLYNNGMTGAPNHAYVLDAAHRATLLAAGWIAEGVAYCVTVSDADAAQETAKLAGTTWLFPDPPGYFGAGDFPIAFANDVRTNGRFDRDFHAFGTVTPPAAIAHTNVFGAWRGVAGFVPTSHKTIVVGNTGFEGGDVKGVAFEVEDAGAASANVCAMVVHLNVVEWSGFAPTKLHGWQPYLWSACERGVARRM
jgi:hypothetical protein